MGVDSNEAAEVIKKQPGWVNYVGGQIEAFWKVVEHSHEYCVYKNLRPSRVVNLA